jgi:hypothetical protein
MATDKTDNSAQEAILEALNKMAKAVKGGTDAQKEGNKISKRTLTSSEGVVKGLGIAKGLITKMLTVQGDLNRAFLGFGRNLDSSLGSFTKDLMGATTTMAEDMKAVTGVFSVGIKQNVAHTVKLNHSLLVLGKDTSKWNKTIAAQNQVYRQNAKHTGSLVEAMIDNTLRAKLDTDKLATAITGLSTTMDHLAVTMGAGVPMMAVEAIANMQNELGNQSFTDMATKVLSFYLSSANSDKLLKLTGGKMNLTSVGGFEDLIRVIGRESLRAFKSGQNLGGGFLQHYAGPKFAGALGATSDAALMGGMIANPIPGDHTTGRGLSELAKQAAQNDLLRTMSILFKDLSVALVPMITSLTLMVNANIVPDLHLAMKGLAGKIRDMVRWMEKYITPTGNLGGNSNAGGGGNSGFPGLGEVAMAVNEKGFNVPAASLPKDSIGPPWLQGIKQGSQAPWTSVVDGLGQPGTGALGGNALLRGLKGKSFGTTAKELTGMPSVMRNFQRLKNSMINRHTIGGMFTNKGLTGGRVRITDPRLAKVLGEGIEKGTIMTMEAFAEALSKSGYGSAITKGALLRAGFQKGKNGLAAKLILMIQKNSAWWAAKAAGKRAAVKFVGGLALGAGSAAMDLAILWELGNAAANYFWPDTFFEMDQANKTAGQTVGAMAFKSGNSLDDLAAQAKLISDWTGDPLEDVLNLITLQYEAAKTQRQSDRIMILGTGTGHSLSDYGWGTGTADGNADR